MGGEDDEEEEGVNSEELIVIILSDRVFWLELATKLLAWSDKLKGVVMLDICVG